MQFQINMRKRGACGRSRLRVSCNALTRDLIWVMPAEGDIRLVESGQTFWGLPAFVQATLISPGLPGTRAASYKHCKR